MCVCVIRARGWRHLYRVEVGGLSHQRCIKYKDRDGRPVNQVLQHPPRPQPFTFPTANLDCHSLQSLHHVRFHCRAANSTMHPHRIICCHFVIRRILGVLLMRVLFFFLWTNPIKDQSINALILQQVLPEERAPLLTKNYLKLGLSK